jgi:hypothetical protein
VLSWRKSCATNRHEQIRPSPIEDEVEEPLINDPMIARSPSCSPAPIPPRSDCSAHQKRARTPPPPSRPVARIVPATSSGGGVARRVGLGTEAARVSCRRLSRPRDDANYAMHIGGSLNFQQDRNTFTNYNCIKRTGTKLHSNGKKSNWICSSPTSPH